MSTFRPILSPSDRDGLPSYSDLPIRPGLPPGSAWGVFGDDDEVGALNLITAADVAHAGGLVRRGATFALNWDIALPNPSIFSRQVPRQVLRSDAVSNEDHFDDFWPQGSSQWDALCHIRHPEYLYYNGVAESDIPGHGGTRLGIHNWARRGIVGRFVLVDVARHLDRIGQPLDQAERVSVPASLLDQAIEAQGVEIRGGDILLLHFGWTTWYESLSQAEREDFVNPDGTFTSPGLEAGPTTAAWLWDNHFAAVAADCPTVEPMPFDFDPPERWLHFLTIPLLGIALGEMLDLAALAADCAATGQYEGLFTAAPLHAVGGVGSPANAIAIV